jgi:hypothetical protein
MGDDNDLTTDDRRTPLSAAWTRLEDQRNWYSSKSKSCQHAYMRVKLAQLIISASVPVLAGLAAPAAVTSGIAAVVVVLEGVQQLYQWHANWILYRSTAESLKHERYLYLAHAGPYAGPDRDRVLAERVEGLVSREHSKWTEGRNKSGKQRDNAEDTEAG